MKISLRQTIVLLLMLAVNLNAETTYYVDAGRSDDDGDGSSWAEAKQYLQSALALAVEGDEIWVAKGVYYSNDGCDDDNQRICSFNIPNGVQLYGGFFGNETQLIDREKSDRNEDGIQKEWEFTYPSILSGDIDQDDPEIIAETWENISGDNAYNVVTFSNASSETVLDGFTITAGGSSNDMDRPSGSYGYGGGISDKVGGDSNPTVRNCIIQGNRAYRNGGGIHLANGTFEYCLIKANKSISDGGGVKSTAGSFKFCSFIGNHGRSGGGANVGGEVTVTHCIFIDNQASYNGGGISTSTSASLSGLKYCLFAGNHASNDGGALYTWRVSLTNCTVAYNTAGRWGGGIFVNRKGETSKVTANHSIIWGNTAEGHSRGQVGPSGNQIHLGHQTRKSDATIRNSNIEGMEDDFGFRIKGTWTYTGFKQELNPWFSRGNKAADVPHTESDYRLLAGSPMIDYSGEEGELGEVDLDNVPYSTGDFLNMGPYEVTVPGPRFYVKSDVEASGDGKSWETAYKTLPEALTKDIYLAEIWVAYGDYDYLGMNLPSRQIYGGFQGTETSIDERLKEDKDGDGIVQPWEFTHVSTNTGVHFASKIPPDPDSHSYEEWGVLSDANVLDGFTITENSTGPFWWDKKPWASAVAVVNAGTIANCIIKNTTYGVYSAGIIMNSIIKDNHNGATNVEKVTGCVINGNRGYGLDRVGTVISSVISGNGGKGIVMNGVSTIISSVISGNGGTGIASPKTVVNSRISGNGDSGIYGRDMTLTNCTIVGNYKLMSRVSTGSGAGGVNLTGGNVSLTNCIVWGNIFVTPAHSNPDNTQGNNQIYLKGYGDNAITISHSNIQGSGGSESWASDFMGHGGVLGTDGGGNIDSDPMFFREVGAANGVATEAGNFNLVNGSLALDAGDDYAPDLAAYNIENDLNGDPRIQDSPPDAGDQIDMGAYEGGVDAKVIFVASDATGAGTGVDWTNAFRYLQDALQGAYNGCRIYVKGGTYYPDESMNGGMEDRREASFQINAGISVYGGLSGVENPDDVFLLENRDLEANQTILSGDIDGDDSNIDGNYIAETTADIQGSNAYHVVTLHNAILDGFTITAGSADDDNVATNPFVRAEYDREGGRGGGIIIGNNGPSTISNCFISGNKASKDGGGIYSSSTDILTINNCEIFGNMAEFSGGGIKGHELNMQSCQIRGNQGGIKVSRHGSRKVYKGVYPYQFVGGGGIYFTGGKIANSVISGNIANSLGGGIFLAGETGKVTDIINCTITGNYASTDWYNDGGYGGRGVTEDYVGGSAIFFGGRPGTTNSRGQNMDNVTATLNITNSIFWKNQTHQEGQVDRAFWKGEASTAHYDNILKHPDCGDCTINISNSVIEYSGAPDEWEVEAMSISMAVNFSTKTDNTSQDPRFREEILPQRRLASISGNFTPGDFEDTPSSTIDAGDDDAWLGVIGATDIEGNERIRGQRVDIGAYETNYMSDVTPPAIVSTCPGSKENCSEEMLDFLGKNISDFGVSKPIILVLDEIVTQGTGTIKIKQGELEVASIPLPDPSEPKKVEISRIEIEGEQHSKIDIKFPDLVNNTEYVVEIPAGAFKDEAAPANNFSGIGIEGVEATWHFIFDREPPRVSFNPSNGASGVPIDTEITLTFTEKVELIEEGEGVDLDLENVRDIITLREDGPEGKIIDSYAASVELVELETGGSGHRITLEQDSDFTSEKQVYVEISGSQVQDPAGNPLGETQRAIFTTADIEAPTVTFSPSHGTVGVPPNSNITITFNEPVVDDDGVEIKDKVEDLITLRTANAGGEIIDFTAEINEAKTIITVDPTSNFLSFQVVYVALDGEVQDEAGNNVSGSLEATLTTAVVTAPEVDVTTDVVSPTSIQSFPITVSFNNLITLFDQSDIEITEFNQSRIEIDGEPVLRNFAEPLPGREFTVDITPSNLLEKRTTSIAIPAESALDAIGTGNSRSEPILEIIYDPDPPTMEFLPTHLSPNTPLELEEITLTFNKRVKKLNEGGSAEDITGENLSDFITLKKAKTDAGVDFSIGEGDEYVDYASTVINRFELPTGGVGTKIILNPEGSTLDSKSDYYVAVDAEKIVDYDRIDLVYGGGYAIFQTIDNEGPMISRFDYLLDGALSTSHAPGDFLTGVPRTSNLVIVFDENVILDQEGTLVLYKKRIDEEIQMISTITLLSDNGVTGNNTQNIEIDFDDDLENKTEYYITLTPGSVKDFSNNEFAGIVDATTWNFRSRDEDPPEYASHTPNPDSKVEGNREIDLSAIEPQPIFLNFNEPVVAGRGTIEIYNAAFGASVESIDISDPDKIFIGDNSKTVQLLPNRENLEDDTEYYILINGEVKSEGALVDKAGPPNPLADITNPSLIKIKTSDIGEPTILSYNVTERSNIDATTFSAVWESLEDVFLINENVALTSRIQINFDESLFKSSQGGGAPPEKIKSKNIVGALVLLSDSQEEGTPVPFEITIAAEEKEITLDPIEDLESETTYFLKVKGNMLEDGSGNVIQEDKWASFVTADITVPTLVSTEPERSASDVNIDIDLVLTFNEPIATPAPDTEPGNIIIMKEGSDAPVATFDLTDTESITNVDRVITINLEDLLESTSAYHVLIDEDAIYDLSGNAYAGIDDPEVFAFTTGDFEPPEVTFTPEHRSSSIAVDTDLIIAFSEPITIDEDGGITDENVASLISFLIRDEEMDDWENVPFSAAINDAGDQITLTLSDDEDGNLTVLLGDTLYIMEIDDRIMDAEENSIDPKFSGFWTAPTDAPTVTISTEVESPTNVSPIAVAIEFSEAVIEFYSKGVTVEGGEFAAQSFSGEGASYSVSTITLSEGEVSVQVEGNEGFNQFDTGNAASNELVLIYDSTSPIVIFAPADSTLDASLASKVYITFSEPVFTSTEEDPPTFEPVALDDLTGTVSVRKDSIDGEVQSFDMAYNDTTGVIKLTPPDGLISAAHYYVAVTTELYDEAGNSFAGDSAYFKAEDIEPPTITLVPANGATDVAVNTYMRVIFSERVYSETGEKFEDFEVSNGMVVVREDNASGSILNIGVQISPDTSALTLQTDELLESERTYYVQVNPRFADVNGTVAEGVSATFTTADVTPPEITLSPADGTEDVALEAELVISFSESVRLTDNSVITAENVKNLLYVNLWNPEGEAIEFTVMVNAARDEVTLTPSEALPPYEKIVYGLNDGLEDYSDNLAGSEAGYFFTTGIPGFAIDPLSGVTTTETGLSDTFEVVLTSEPDAPVEVSLISTDITEGMPYPTQLTFTRFNWDQAQWVKVTGVDDPDADEDITYHVRLFYITSEDPDYNDFEVDSVEVININDDPPGVQVYPISRLITNEGGKQAQFGVVLLSRPSDTVTIPVSTSDVTEASVDVTQLVFEPEEWDQRQFVTLTGLDDVEDDDEVEYSVVLGQCVSQDADYSVIDPTDVLAINIDDDVAGFMVSDNKVVRTHEMGSDTLFTVVLNTEPTGTVAISVSSDDPTEGTVSHDYITFTPANWNVPQEVTVTGVNDNLGDGDVYYNIVVGEAIISASPAYSRLAAKEVKAVNLDMEPEIVVGSDFMSFDSSDVGVLDSAFVTVVNSGTDTLFLTQASVNDSSFSAMFATSPIKSGDSSQVTVYFLPDQQGKKESVLYMEHNDPYQFPTELLISVSVLDRSGPAIIELGNNPSTVSTGSGIEVMVEISDATGVSKLELNYTSGSSEFSSLNMEGDTQTSFSGTIPTGTADLTGLAYFIVATDLRGNITYSDTISVPVTFGDKLLSTDVPGSAYPSGISKDAWRLISVPNMIDENKATQIFGNELKKKNIRTWRMVKNIGDTGGWEDVKEITPGMGMWLYQQVKDNISISTGSGTTSDLSRYELTVRPGWSIIGSPYAFSFEADIDGETFSGPFAYALDGVEGWSDVVTQFQPWAGYIIKNLTSEDQALVLRPLASAGTDSSLKRGIAGKHIGWTVNLSALSGRVGDLYNKMGRQAGASESIGPFDHAEPPIMPEGISLSFRQDNGRSKKLMYTRDMRSMAEHNGTWPVDLRVKDVKQPISLTAEIDAHYPLDLGLVILDHQTREVTDLREDPDLKIDHRNEDVPYRFTVVSGDGDYIIRKVEEILAGIPERFSLGQNYPNPFNSTTTIRYALPLPELVNITIYNILGQEVHKMVGSWQEAGFHTARWDGRDLQGIPVSSGIYIYHIQAGKFMAAKKMAIIK